MSTKSANPSPPHVEADEARSALERVLASRYFVNAHKKKAFLGLVCDLYLEGRGHELNEYRLGFEVFGRERDYNPSADPIVRVVAHEIRKKLELYYQAEGADDEVRLELPSGTYQPVFTRHAAAAPSLEPAPEPHHGPATPIVPLEPPAPPAPAPRRATPATLWLSAAVVVLAVALVFVASSKRAIERTAAEAADARSAALRGPLWTPFARDATPPLVILSNPPVLRVANATDLDIVGKDSIPIGPEVPARMKDRLVTDPEVLVREGDARSGEAHTPPIVHHSSAPRLVYSTSGYTGIGEAIGLHRLTDYFRSADRSIVLKQSRTVSAEDLKNHNLILLGGGWVNEWSAMTADTQDFVFTSGGTVGNRRPEAGEATEYIPEFDGATGSIVVDYALVTVTSNLTDANEQMILAGVYSQGTEAAAEYVTERTYVEQLEARLRQLAAGDEGPLYFQALLKVKVENGIPTTISLLALHRLGQ
jgi:hypothetical protein